MRSTEERVAAVAQRVRERQRKNRDRRSLIIGLSSAGACLCSIAGLAIAMPGIMANLPGGEYRYFGAAAGIFNGTGAIGYVLIGVLAFSLGVCVTILCYRIRQKNWDDRDDAEGCDG
ncbi:MAG: hypothetical protein WCY55_03465 [Anaerovoracaceae bacterium]